MCVRAHFLLSPPKVETFERALKTEPTSLCMMIEILGGLE